MKLVVAVDPNGTSLELVRDIDSTRDIAREDGSSKTIDSVVGLTDQILLIVEFDDHDDRAEDFYRRTISYWMTAVWEAIVPSSRILAPSLTSVKTVGSIK